MPATKKYYTVEEANATLPYLRLILRDITNLAHEMHERQNRLARFQNAGSLSPAHAEEVVQMIESLQNDQDQMQSYLEELNKLDIELKDYFVGLIDFRCLQDGREVYLCWRMDEPSVNFWHELDTGFAGRQQLPRSTSPSSNSVN